MHIENLYWRQKKIIDYRQVCAPQHNTRYIAKESEHSQAKHFNQRVLHFLYLSSAIISLFIYSSRLGSQHCAIWPYFSNYLKHTFYDIMTPFSRKIIDLQKNDCVAEADHSICFQCRTTSNVFIAILVILPIGFIFNLQVQNK